MLDHLQLSLSIPPSEKLAGEISPEISLTIRFFFFLVFVNQGVNGNKGNKRVCNGVLETRHRRRQGEGLQESSWCVTAATPPG